MLWDDPAFYGSNSFFCRAQTHGRFFEDVRHSEAYGHAATNQFMIANFHREGFFHGKGITEGPDQTRRRVLRIVERGHGTHYCVGFNYGMHHEARPEYGDNFPYDKVLGRISSRTECR